MSDAVDLPDASDEVTTNNRRSDAARHAREDADVLRKLMHTPHGRAWFYRTLDACHIYGNPFVPGQADTTGFRCGEQNVGKRLLMQAMDASPDLYLTMVREAREEEQRVQKTTRERNEKLEGRDTDMQPVAQGSMDLPIPDGFKK